MLAFVGVGAWPLAGIFLVPFWWALERLRRRGWGAAAAAGLVFGAVAHAGGHLWLWRLVDVFLGGDRGLGALLWAAHELWFAAGFGLYALLFAVVRARGGSLAAAGIAPWLLVEWLQLQIFPVHAGSSLAGVTPLVQIADLGGPLALSACVLVVDLAVYRTLAWRFAGARRPTGSWAAVGLLLVGMLVYGAVRIRWVETRMERAPSVPVGLVQANLEVLEKRREARRGHEVHVALTRELLAAGPLELVVWPETAELRAIRGPLPVSGRFVVEDLGVPLLFGGTVVDPDGGRRARSNAALLVEADGMIRQAYRKNLLIPLAESIPFGRLLPALASRLPHAQDFVAARGKPALETGPLRIATPICYEAVRPGFVREMVASARPNLLVTLANDAWFGDSQEPWMHLQLARLRAVEHRRYLVRATNSGISAIVDPAGRIVERSGLLARETLRGVVHPLEGLTLYARVGDWPGWLAAAALAASLLRPGAPRAWTDRSRPQRQTAASARS